MQRDKLRYIEIKDKKDKSLIRIVLARSFKKAIKLFIEDDEQKNVYCKNFTKI